MTAEISNGGRSSGEINGNQQWGSGGGGSDRSQVTKHGQLLDQIALIASATAKRLPMSNVSQKTNIYLHIWDILLFAVCH